MSNIKRLKFAYARGALIQWQSIDGSWIDYKCEPWWHTAEGSQSQPHRIHPDDAHLEYGPLSSALRNTVIDGVTAVAFHSATGAVASLFPELQNEWWDLSGDARLMQFLFIAELLADEGL